MKGSLLFLSIALALIGILCNAYFYGSFGGINDFSETYAIIGLFLDLGKFILVPVGVYYFSQRMVVEASIAGGFWLVLTFISLVAAFGFLSIKNSEYEVTALAQSATFESAKAQVESANAKVESLSKYANENSEAQLIKSDLENQLNTLLNSTATNSIGQNSGHTVSNKVGSCNGNTFYQRKYCPQINDLKSQISNVNQSTAGHEQYLSALSFRDNALKQLSELNVEATSTYHPVFENAALMFGIHPNKFKVGFIGITSLVLELLASALIYLRSRMTFSEMGRTFEGTAESTHEKKGNELVPQNAPEPSQEENSSANGIGAYANGRARNEAASPQNESANGIPVSDEKPANGRTLSEKEQKLYEKLENAVRTKELLNLSYPKLKEFLGIKNSSLIGKLRDQLVWRKHAVYDSTRKCIPITD